MISQINNTCSSSVIYLGTKNSSTINKKLIAPKVIDFFTAQKIDKYQEINKEDLISDMDFKKIDFSYFYEKVFFDISKYNNIVEIIPKYCITIDKNSCKLTCEKSGISYDQIVLYKTPILFFIYISINEILDFIRQDDFNFTNY